jgi:hypothetical protein
MTSSTITIGKLHKALSVLIEEGHARKSVCVSKETFSHPCEVDGCTILEVCAADLEWIEQIDEGGYLKENKDGTTAGKYCYVLKGQNVT